MADKKKSTEPRPEDVAPTGVDPKAVYIGGESLADRIVPHLKKIFIAIGVVALILSVFFTWRWWQDRKAQKATSALMLALDQGRLEIREVDPDDPNPEIPAEGAPPTFASKAERAQAVLAKLRQTEGEPRQSAALLEAAMLFETGQLDAAEVIYRRLASGKGVEGVLAREGLGYVAEARAATAEGDARTQALQAALAAFRQSQPDDAGPRRDYALYHEGRMLAQLGQKDEARAALEKALEKASPDLEATIEVRLTQLDAANLPQLPAPGAAPAPTPTPTPDPAPTPTPAPPANP